MRHDVILVLLDGLNHSVARDCMGHLQALCGAGRGQSYRLECELPSLSRPLYECILTGVPPIDSGILHNDVVRLSQEQSLFHYARAAGLSTAAAAYHWVSELYNRAPFDPARDRHTDDSAMPIQRGHFYWSDHYPDSHLFADAESLRRRHAPNFMLVHSMNIDDAGHRHGLASPAYRNAARRADALLSEYLHQWLAAGYQVAITADHGMNEDRSHGGILEEEREVPLFVFGDAFSRDDLAQPLQTDLCGTLCEILGAAHDKPVCRGCSPHETTLRQMAGAAVPAALRGVLRDFPDSAAGLGRAEQPEGQRRLEPGQLPRSCSARPSTARRSATAWRSPAGRACSACSSRCSAAIRCATSTAACATSSWPSPT